jgi:protein SCO1/2
MRRTARRFWLGCALLLASFAPAHAEHPAQRVDTAAAGWPLAEFALTDQRGAPFTKDRLRGRWTLLLLEDSACADPCETALAALAGLFERIRDTQAVRTVQVVLVTPGRDGEPPQRLGHVLARHDPRFIAASGSRAALAGLADDLGGALPDDAGSPRKGAGSIWMIGPDGILRGELLPPFDVLALTSQFMRTRARG